MAKHDQRGSGIGYALFDTMLGPCGVAWSTSGITRVQLPEADALATEERLARWSPDIRKSEPIPLAARAIDELQGYFRGMKTDFAGVTLDLGACSPFHREIYATLRRVGWGETTTYGGLADRLGMPGAARAIGQAMGRNPVPVIVPCHRVLAAGGKPGGFSSFGGRVTKGRLLALEGVNLEPAAPLLALMGPK